MAQQRTRPRAVLPAALQDALQTWRRAHPNATFAEMEAGVGAMLNDLRPRMLEELAAAATETVQLCTACGERMQRRGNRRKTVVTEGDQMVALERPYWTCPSCKLGLFPPG